MTSMTPNMTPNMTSDFQYHINTWAITHSPLRLPFLNITP